MYRITGQALLELAIWSVLLLIGAGAVVSYTLGYVYQQRVMIRNFELAKQLAANPQISAAGGMVYHTLMEHHTIPVIHKFLPEPEYRLFMAQTSVMWTRRLFHGSSPQVYDVWRVIIDGENLAQKMNILAMRQAAGKAGPGVRSRNDVFILDLPPLDEINSRQPGILNALSNATGLLVKVPTLRTAAGNLYNDVRNWFTKAQEIFADSIQTEKAWENRNSGTINQVKVYRDRASTLARQAQAQGQGEAANELTKAANGLNGLYNYLYAGAWQMDLDMNADAFLPGYKQIPQWIKKKVTYTRKGKHGNLTIQPGEERVRVFDTNYDQKEITWKAPNEKWKW